MIHRIEPLIPGDDLAWPRICSTGIVLAVVACCIAIGLVSPRSIGLNLDQPRRQFLLAFLYTPLLFVVTLPALVVAIVLRPPQEALLTSAAVQPSDFVAPVSAWLAGVASAVLEEVTVRGLLLTRVWRATRSWTLGALVASAFFAWMHAPGGTALVVSTFLTSMVLSVLFVHGGGLLPTIVCHALGNIAKLGLAALRPVLEAAN